MSGLEVFGLVVLAMLIYSVVSIALALLITGGDMEAVPWIALGVGCLIFIFVMVLWANGKPFPLGGGA